MLFAADTLLVCSLAMSYPYALLLDLTRRVAIRKVMRVGLGAVAAGRDSP